MANAKQRRKNKRLIARLTESGDDPKSLEEQARDAELAEAQALRDRHEQVCKAFREKFAEPNEYGEAHLAYYDVAVFEDFVVCAKDGKHFRTSYEMTEGEVVLGDALEQVEVEFRPVSGPSMTQESEDAGALPDEPHFRESHELVTSGALREAKSGKGWVWGVTIIRAGHTVERTMAGGQKFVRDYPIKVLESSVPLFEGASVFAFSEKEHASNPGAKGVRDQVGFLENVRRSGNALVGDLRIFEDNEWLRTRLLGLKEAGKVEKVGLSIDAGGSGQWVKESDLAVYRVTKIEKVFSVDVVHSPAAGGRVDRLVASTEEEVMGREQILKLIENVRPELLKGKDVEKLSDEDLEGLMKEAMTPADPAEEAKPEKPAARTTESSANGDEEGGEGSSRMTEAVERVKTLENEMKIDRCGRTLESRLSEAEGLPKTFKAKIRKRFEGRVFETADLDEAIQEEIEALGSLSDPKNRPQSYGAVQVTAEEREKKERALEAMFWSGAQDRTHPGFPDELKGVRPYRSIHEAYYEISGQRGSAEDIMLEAHLSRPPEGGYEGTKIHESWQRQMESLTVSSFGQMLGDSIRRRMIAEYNLPGLQKWRNIVSDVGSINDFRTNRRMRMGGYGTLPAVTEGGTYGSLTSPTDEEETYAVSKKGGLEDVTFEMIKNDDVGSIRRIPVKMGRAGAQGLYRGVFDLLEDNGNLVSDSTALIHANHNNSIGAVLSNSALTTGYRLMMDQSAYNNSSELLENTPRWLVHPTELVETAHQLTSSWREGQGEHDLEARNTNFHASYGLQPLHVGYFAVATDYWLVADPMNIPTIEVGFLDGRREPELFVQDQPNVGSQLTADKLTYKVRFIWGVCVLDYRGFAAYIA